MLIKPGYYETVQKLSNGTLTSSFKAEPGLTLYMNQTGIIANKNFKRIRSTWLKDIHFLDDGIHGWITGGDGLILRTDDGGKSWRHTNIVHEDKGYALLNFMEPHNTNLNSDINRIFFTDPENGWAIGNGGLIAHSIDGGEHWKLQESNIVENLDNVYFLNKNVGYASTYIEMKTSFLLKTTDGGSSWIKLDRSSYSDKYFFPKPFDIWKARAKALLQSTDEILTWKEG